MFKVLDKVARTKPFSPSKISIINSCPLRYLLETESYHSVSPPSNIYALTGTAIHKIIEDNLSNPSISGAEIKKQFLGVLDRLAINNKRAPLICWVYEKFGLGGTLANERVISSVQQIKRLLDKYGKDKSLERPDTKLPSQKYEFSSLGAEKWFELAKFELAGKIDLSYLDDEGVIHVVDFKSGKVIDDEGLPKEEYLLQIGVYGLMVEDSTSHPNLLLELIGSHTSWSGCLDESLRGRVVDLITYAKNNLPLNKEINASEISITGDHCLSCRSRFACGKYVNALNKRVHGEESSICSPCDVTGVVKKTSTRGDLIDLIVSPIGGITCSIMGLPRSLYPEFKEGDLIAGYFLGVLDIENRCNFPANFYVFRDEAPRMSSFESMVALVDAGSK
jgi:hypothetical protein